MKDDQGHFVIECVKDFHLFEIIYHERYKPGVFKVWMKKDLKEHAKLIIAFCKDEFMPVDIDAHNKYWTSQ